MISTCRRLVRGAVAVRALACAAVLSACHEDGVSPVGATIVRLSIASRVSGSLSRSDRPTVAVSVRYVIGPLGNPTLAPALLGAAVVDLDEAPGVVNIPVEFDLAPCLADQRRLNVGDACSVVVSLVLRNGASTVDSVQVGPVDVEAGSVVTVPQSVELRSVTRLELSWPGRTPSSIADTVRSGSTLPLTVTPRDATGAAMSDRAMVWSSDSPSIASVNASTGLVTGVAPGTAVVSVTGGGRVATFTARVLAAAQRVQVVAGDGQRVPAGGVIPLSPTVRVTDTASRPAAQVLVTFRVVGGGGQHIVNTQRTDSLGEARLGTWTTGSVPAVNTIEASVSGVASDTIRSYGTIAPVLDQLVSGSAHSCLIGLDGVTRCFGGGSFGQLGDGLTAVVSSRVAVTGNPSFTTLRLQAQHTCGLQANGVALCWGRNQNGAARGDGVGGLIQAVPIAVAGGPYRALSPGRLTTCGITLAGAAVCWGLNQAGEIGDGTTLSRTTPVPVATSLAFTSIESSWIHSCGLTSTGAAYCWGREIGGTSNLLTPTAVSGALVFSRIFSGGTHACALTSLGEAWCWGPNFVGQLGDGTTTGSTVPVRVSGGLFFSVLATGTVPNTQVSSHSCGITITGKAYCWGTNADGELGDGTTTTRTVPTAVLTDEVFVAITAGERFSCAMTPDRRVFCWGSNAQGELGSGTIGGRSTIPVLVP